MKTVPMRDPLLDNLEAIFSILPADQAEEALQKTLMNFRENRDLFKNELKWADFDSSGKFLGGGASDIGGFSVRTINNAIEDQQIERLIALAKNGGAMAGLMERSPSQNCVYWFLPVIQHDHSNFDQQNLRGLVVSEILFNEVLGLFNIGRRITTAERHLAFQIVTGQSLREAADSDGLAFETKRAQLKSLCAKMQCSGQSDLLRVIIGQMTYLQSISGVRNLQSELVEEFVGNYLCPDTRVILQRLPNGRSIHVFEIGPTNGKPILLIHGMLWPLLFQEYYMSLVSHNIRLIVPLRSGYIGNFTDYDIYGHTNMVEQSLEDIALFHHIFLNAAVPVIGHSYGGPIAVRYAAIHPLLVTKLVLVSINTGENNDVNRNFIGRFFGGLKLMSNKKGVFRYLTWQFKKYYSDEKVVKRVLQKVFRDSEHDMQVLEGVGSKQSTYRWFVEMYQKSIPGIADDFLFVMEEWQESIPRIGGDILFIHGENDPLVDISIIQKCATLGQSAKVRVVPKAGHHLIRSHSKELWDIVCEG